jgi:hypothetical protein
MITLAIFKDGPRLSYPGTLPPQRQGKREKREGKERKRGEKRKERGGRIGCQVQGEGHKITIKPPKQATEGSVVLAP